jgi:hypothetical protein
MVFVNWLNLKVSQPVQIAHIYIAVFSKTNQDIVPWAIRNIKIYFSPYGYLKFVGFKTIAPQYLIWRISTD